MVTDPFASLAPATRAALLEVAEREGQTLADLATAIFVLPISEADQSAAVEAFLVRYYQAAAGHAAGGLAESEPLEVALAALRLLPPTKN